MLKSECKVKGFGQNRTFLEYRKKKKKKEDHHVMNAFFNAQFSYCPLTWMFHCRKLNNKIHGMHEKWLRIVYNDNTSLYEEFLEIDNSVSVHHRNIQILATGL